MSGGMLFWQCHAPGFSALQGFCLTIIVKRPAHSPHGRRNAFGISAFCEDKPFQGLDEILFYPLATGIKNAEWEECLAHAPTGGDFIEPGCLLRIGTAA